MTYEVEDNKIKSFTDLHTWQEGHKLVIAIYQATKSFACRRKLRIAEPNAKGGRLYYIKHRRRFLASIVDQSTTFLYDRKRFPD